MVSSELQLIFTIVGLVLGLVCGYFVGGYKVYKTLRNNVFADDGNPEIKKQSNENNIVVVIIGMVFSLAFAIVCLVVGVINGNNENQRGLFIVVSCFALYLFVNFVYALIDTKK